MNKINNMTENNINLKECMYYEKKDNNIVKCVLCPKNCLISNNKTGSCKTRINYDGKLYSLTYGKPMSIAIDPIEKKPFAKFHQGEKTLSFGTLGCNLNCKFCQNYDISQANPEDYNDVLKVVSSEEIIKKCKENNIKIIAFTYTEPTIFYEYMLEIAKLAKKNNIECIIVSNGFINSEPLKELCKYISAANIDLKSYDNEFYKKICNGLLDPVLNSLKILKNNNIHIEITNLIIENYNDNLTQIENMAKWISNNLGKEIILHLTRAFPMYLMTDINPTPMDTLYSAKEICEKYLDNVFLGNI